jgi:hypothetical protein
MEGESDLVEVLLEKLKFYLSKQALGRRVGLDEGV